jgi:uncharacterized integral membrane protein
MMGEKYFFQPLTKEDKISVILYRAGIVLSAIIISIFAYMLFNAYNYQNYPVHRILRTSSLKFNVLVISLYISVAISVFSIHLYASKFKKALKRLYYISVVALIVLFLIGKGDLLGVLAHKPYSPILFIPLSGCLGFITAKEAFCFKLMEGYLLALIMPLYLFLFSIGFMTMRGASYGLLLIALLLIFFTFRKVFMPIHYDIGDKSAYT